MAFMVRYWLGLICEGVPRREQVVKLPKEVQKILRPGGKG